jgi:heme A synthase
MSRGFSCGLNAFCVHIGRWHEWGQRVLTAAAAIAVAALVVFAATVGRFFQQAQAVRLAPGYADFSRHLGQADFSPPWSHARATEVARPQKPDKSGAPRRAAAVRRPDRTGGGEMTIEPAVAIHADSNG